MIIDFHTHIFPDKIAKKTVEYLNKVGNITPHTDGTTAALLSEMEKAGVDIAVNQPVLTNPNSFESVNRFAIEVNEYFRDKDRRVISFGGIHPACEDIEGKMAWLKDNGFLGVKIHPDYQGTLINDDGYVRIVKSAIENDLIVLTHAGIDAAYPDNVHCPAPLAKELLSKVPHKKFVLAHFGGPDMQEEFLNTFGGSDIYFDTAYVLRFMTEESVKTWVERHGEDKILFASDSPWSVIKGDVEILKSFSLGKNTEEKLFSLNAKKLLGI